MIKVSPQDLSEAALAGIIEAFVLREGTDYGHHDYSLSEKCARVRAQIDAGEAVIWFDPQTESTTVRPADPRRR